MQQQRSAAKVAAAADAARKTRVPGLLMIQEKHWDGDGILRKAARKGMIVNCSALA